MTSHLTRYSIPMDIVTALPTQARAIARLIMTAMTTDCCLYYAGPAHTIADFEELMTAIVVRTDSQYSYCNTLVAMEHGDVIGVCTSYDGGQLHALRQAFIDETRQRLGRDFSDMEDETQAGELYIDSLCVAEAFRGRGIASALLGATIDRARRGGFPAAGLLVDTANPRAEQLYTRLGFVYQNDATWGGHAMRHLQYQF